MHCRVARQENLPHNYGMDYHPDLPKRYLAHRKAGGTVSSFASELGVTTGKLYSWKNSHPVWKDAMERGRKQEEQFLLERAIEMVKNGQAGMCKFLLQSRHGYQTRHEVHGKLGWEQILDEVDKEAK